MNARCISTIARPVTAGTRQARHIAAVRMVCETGAESTTGAERSVDAVSRAATTMPSTPMKNEGITW